MDNSVEPTDVAAKVAEYIQALSKYKKANKDQKKKMGGTGYRRNLEKEITRLEEQTHSVKGPMQEDVCAASHEGPAQADPNDMDVDLTAASAPAERLLDGMPFRQLNNFKEAWKLAPKSFQGTGLDTELKETWNALQTAGSVVLKSLNIVIQDPAWPGPNFAPTFAQILATAEWLSKRIPGFVEPPPAAPQPTAKEPVYKIKDPKMGRLVVMTNAMMLEARMDPEAHPGCIEGGPKLAARVLINRNKNEKCISCESGGRGQSMSTKGSALRGDGPGFLNKCRCPVDAALTESWMYKITSTDPNVPKWDDSKTPKRGAIYPASDFSLNPVSLRIVGSAIHAASGLTTRSLFQPPHLRYAHTIRWCFNQLALDTRDARKLKRLQRAKDNFKQALLDMNEMGDDQSDVQSDAEDDEDESE